MNVELNIYRFDPDAKQDPRYDQFEIEAEPGETVLSALIRAYENCDASLSFRFACGKVKCGECSVMVNKSPYLACDKQIEPQMVIEPLPNLPIIKDLVIDRNKALNGIFKLAPSLFKLKNTVDGADALDSQGIDAYIRMTTCFECLICQSVCPVRKKSGAQFVGPLGLLWYAKASLTDGVDLKEMREAVKMCSQCGECWKACPSKKYFLEDAIKGLLNKLQLNR